MWWGGTVLHSLRRATALAKLFGGHCGREANGGVVGAGRWPHHWFVGPRGAFPVLNSWPLAGCGHGNPRVTQGFSRSLNSARRRAIEHLH